MKILIIRLSSLGDIILTQPILATLRQVYPNAEIDYITKPEYGELVKLFKEVNKMIEWKGVFKTKKELQAQKYDIVIDLHAKGSTWNIKKMCRPDKTVTYNKKHLLRMAIVKKWTGKSIYSTLDLYHSALRKLGIKPLFDAPKLQINSTIDLTPGKELKIAVFPGATHPTKRLPLEKWIALCNNLQSCNAEIFIHGSKAEKQICAELFTKISNPKKQNLCGTQSISELVHFVADMDVIISNDSGPMHIAAALEKPQVAFFGSTNTRLGFRPLNEKAIVFQTLLPCQPCSLHGKKKCPLGHFKCMKNIDIDVVLSEMEEFILHC
jgi:heptosyltransferase-2